MSEPSDEQKVLEVSLDEARRKYDRLGSDYNNLRSRLFTLLAAELAVSTYLFASKSFMPRQHYGIVLYDIGIGLVVVAAVLLFSAVSSVIWATPWSIPDLKNKYNLNFDKYVQHLRDDYVEAYQFCLEKHQERVKLFDWSIRLFLIGVTLLLIIKFGG